MYNKYYTAIAVILFFTAVTPVYADYTIAPTTDNSQKVSWGYSASDGASKIAVKFTTVGAGTVSAVGIKTIKFGSPTGNARYSLYTDSGSASPGTLITDATGQNAPGDTSCPSGYTTITFDAPVSLSASTDYWVVFDRTAADSSSNYYQSCGHTGSISGFVMKEIVGGGSTWDPITTTEPDQVTAFTLTVVEGGGGGGGDATSTSQVFSSTTQAVDNPTQDWMNGLWLFLVGFWSMIYLFGKKR